MQIKIDAQGFVLSYAIVGNIEGGFEVELPSNFDYEAFQNSPHCYKYENGTLVKDEVKANALLKETEKCKLRQLRKIECFPIINRGQLWYSALSAERVDELNAWYTAWLDVTETYIIPEKPDWLKE